MVLALTLAAQVLVVLDISVVNTALPSIGRDLGLDGSDLAWVVTAYLMMSGGGLLFGGRIADLLSRKWVFLSGLAVFTAASVVSGFAGSATELITARAAQGLSAALMTPAALSIIMTTYSGAQRRTGLALWGAVGSLGVAAGVLLGGALTTWAGWQAIFFINAPIGAIAFLVGLKVVPQVKTPRVTLNQFDLLGAATVIGSLAALVFALGATEQHGWLSARVLLSLTGSALLAIAFIALERRAASPLVPPHTWKVKSLVSGTTVMLGVTGILVGTVFLTSIFVQTVMGYSAIRAGVAFVPFALAITVGTVLAKHALAHATPRTLAAAGLLLVAGGAVLLAQASAGADFATDVLPGHARHRPRRRHGLRPGVRDRPGRHPAAARRHGLRVPHDRARDRRSTRCRRPVSGRQQRRHPDHRGRRRERLPARLPRRRRHRRSTGRLRVPADAGGASRRRRHAPAPLTSVGAMPARCSRPPHERSTDDRRFSSKRR